PVPARCPRRRGRRRHHPARRPAGGVAHPDRPRPRRRGHRAGTGAVLGGHAAPQRGGPAAPLRAGAAGGAGGVLAAGRGVAAAGRVPGGAGADGWGSSFRKATFMNLGFMDVAFLEFGAPHAAGSTSGSVAPRRRPVMVSATPPRISAPPTICTGVGTWPSSSHDATADATTSSSATSEPL